MTTAVGRRREVLTASEARALARLRRLSLALPEAEETTTFGHPTFKIAGQTFAVFDEYKSEYAICFKASLEDQALLTLDPQLYVSPYIGKHGWTSLRVGPALDWAEVETLVRESFRLVAPKRLAAAPDRPRRSGTRRK